MKIPKIVGIVLLGLVLICAALVGCALYQIRPPDDPVSAYIRGEGWHERVSLIPGLLQLGDARTEIEDRLDSYGYVSMPQTTDFMIWFGEIEPGSLVYRLERSVLVCRHDITIEMQFSDSEQLTNAEGGDSGVCL